MEHGAPCDDGHIHLAANLESGSFVFSVRDCGEFEHAASSRRIRSPSAFAASPS